jgi:hypothetical protein
MRKLHAHFCTEIKTLFRVGYIQDANKETARLQTGERQLFIPQVPPALERLYRCLAFKPLRIVCYAGRIPSRPRGDLLCGSQAKASELHKFPYSSIARAENLKSSFLPKFE